MVRQAEVFPSRKLTRRQWVLAAGAPTALAQAPKAPPDDLQAAQSRIRQNGLKLTEYRMPMSTEPALHFKA